MPEQLVSVGSNLVKPAIDLFAAFRRIGQVQYGIGQHVRAMRHATVTDGA
jgi:hypothetical protein